MHDFLDVIGIFAHQFDDVPDIVVFGVVIQ
jgi:hypothetical protein